MFLETDLDRKTSNRKVEGWGESDQEVVSFLSVRPCGRARGLVARWDSFVVRKRQDHFSIGAPNVPFYPPPPSPNHQTSVGLIGTKISIACFLEDIDR